MGLKSISSCLALAAGGALIFGLSGSAQAAGVWVPLVHQPPFNACEPFLLTDGTVLVNGYNTDPNCWKLVPDATGNYVNGSWVQVASMHSARLYYASSVLRDGRLLVSGGEYLNGSSAWTNLTEIYDPVANVWTTLSPPSGWANVGDAPCQVLPDGRVLMGNDFDTRTAIFDPTTNTWSAGPNNLDATADEDTWTLLPDNTILAVECDNHPASEKYNFANNSFMACPTLPVDLVDPGSFEVGGSLLMHDGLHVFCMGATPHSAIYNIPSSPTLPGTWSTGPVPPNVTVGTNQVPLVACDAPMAMMPNGKILLSLSPFHTDGNFGRPTYICEYDGTSINLVSAPVTNTWDCFNTRFLVLPTGQVLMTASNNTVYIYTPDGTFQTSWQPMITSTPLGVFAGSTYSLQGLQFNGLSSGTSYGDDSTNNTNYPIVRIQNNISGHVFYARTFNHSTMGVATGNQLVSTNFTVAAGTESGPSTITVIANGIPSNPQNIDVGFLITGTVTFQNYVGPIGASTPVVVEIRNAGGSGVLQTLTVTPDSGGNYSFPSPPPGTYDFYFKSTHWLKKRVAGVVVTGFGTTGVNPSLRNGDVNGDNVVSLADFGQLRSAFGSSSGNSNWNPMADLNGDGSVGLGDFGILRTNFGSSGDN